MTQLANITPKSEGSIVTGAGAINALLPKTLDEAHRFANAMSQANIMVGSVCRGSVGNSMAVVMQSMRWRMDPFAVSHECYDVKGNLAYGAKLINAVIQANAPITGRLNYEYSGSLSDGTRKVRVFATFIGESEPREIVTPEVKNITIKNSPLWKNDPDQQLAYYGSRTWARRHAPDVIMGVATRDEVEQITPTRNVTPNKLKERLQKRLGTAPVEAQLEPEPVDEIVDVTAKSNVVETEIETVTPPRPAIFNALDVFIQTPNDRAFLQVWDSYLSEEVNGGDMIDAVQGIENHEAFIALSDDAKSVVLSKGRKAANDLLDERQGVH